MFSYSQPGKWLPLKRITLKIILYFINYDDEVDDGIKY